MAIIGLGGVTLTAILVIVFSDNELAEGLTLCLWLIYAFYAFLIIP